MVLYNINPNLKLKKITTHEGNQEYLKNCRKIEEQYYLAKDCITVDGVWAYKNNPNILKDYETGKFFMKQARGRRTYGIIEIDNNLPVYGYFTPNIYKNVKCVDDTRNTVSAISNAIFVKNKNYIEDLSDSIWYYHAEVTAAILKNHQKIVNVHDWTAKKYNIEDNNREFELKKSLYNVYEHPIEDCHKRFGKFLSYSWGIEFEVATGFIPENIQARHGVVVCRDGSITGGEYVTIPLEGAKGLASTHLLCEAAKNRVNLDINCSMHLHLGKFPVRDKKALSALYILCLKVQDEMFSILPPYKVHWEGFKKKNYCRYLESMGIDVIENLSEEVLNLKINAIFDKIFSFISDFRKNYSSYQEGQPHPSGAKWDIENRKTWVNFVNTMYSGRKTLEFRAHQATFNPVKTVNWLFICTAILKYAEKHTHTLLTKNKTITLSDVLNVFCEDTQNTDAQFLSAYLNAYAESRKNEFLGSFKKKDFECSWDLREDSNYDFLLDGKNLLM